MPPPTIHTTNLPNRTGAAVKIGKQKVPSRGTDGMRRKWDASDVLTGENGIRRILKLARFALIISIILFGL